MLRNLRLNALMLATVLMVPMIAAAEAVRAVTGNKIEAYSGLQNVQVRILRVGERLDNRALVQITGIDHTLALEGNPEHFLTAYLQQSDGE